MRINGSEGFEKTGYTERSVASGRVGIEHEKDRWGFRDPGNLVVKELGAEESNGVGEACLGDAHGSPGAFDDNYSPTAKLACAVSIIKYVGFGEVFGESPFAEAIYLVGKE